MEVKEYNVLDGIGKIKLLDIMGSELEIVNTARICTGSESSEMGEKDVKLLKYLIDNQHTSPLEMAKIKLYIKCPIFVARQWLRHRTISVNEKSQRYCDLSDTLEFYIPNKFRKQDPKNKQGSIESKDDPDDMTHSYCRREMSEMCQNIWLLYKRLINMDVCKEQARMILPLCTMTEFIYIQDLHNLIHFLKLRCDEKAQKEIRDYAVIIRDKIIKENFPNVWKLVF